MASEIPNDTLCIFLRAKFKRVYKLGEIYILNQEQ